MAAWQIGRSFETDTPETLERAYSDDIPMTIIEDNFSQVRRYLCKAVMYLIRAAKEADPYVRANPIDDLIEKLDDSIPDELNRVMKKLKEGA